MKKNVLLCSMILTSFFAPELSGQNSPASARPDFKNEKTVLLNRETGLKKNVVYGTIGTVILYGVANGNYERMVRENKKGFINSFWVKVGYGVFYNWEDSGRHFLTGVTALTGSRKSHAEVHVGLVSVYDRTGYQSGVSNADYFSEPRPSKSEYRDILPAGAIGYRFQKPGGSFIFRTGLSFPESFYLSLGFCF